MFRTTYKNAKKSSNNARLLKKAMPTVLLLIVVVLAILQATNSINLFRKSKPASEVVVKAGNVPQSATNNSSTSGTSESKTANPNNTSRTIGGVTDTNGQSNANSSPSNWVSSASGAITVKQPIANATIQNGAILSGSARVSQVDYTLVDNSLGVISQGTLNVVNGNFSGTLQFTPHSSSGQLDVYSTSSFGGPEQNVIEIAVYY